MNVCYQIHVQSLFVEPRYLTVDNALTFVTNAEQLADAYYRQYGHYTKVTAKIVDKKGGARHTWSVKEERGVRQDITIDTESTSTSPMVVPARGAQRQSKGGTR